MEGNYIVIEPSQCPYSTLFTIKVKGRCKSNVSPSIYQLSSSLSFSPSDWIMEVIQVQFVWINCPIIEEVIRLRIYIIHQVKVLRSNWEVTCLTSVSIIPTINVHSCLTHEWYNISHCILVFKSKRISLDMVISLEISITFFPSDSNTALDSIVGIYKRNWVSTRQPCIILKGFFCLTTKPVLYIVIIQFS